MHIQCQFYSPAGTLEHEASTTEKWNGLIFIKSIQVGGPHTQGLYFQIKPKKLNQQPVGGLV